MTIFRVIGRAADASCKRLAETHREAQHLEAELARHPEVAELVHGHQQADADDEPEDIPADFHRAPLGVRGARPDEGGSAVARFGVGRQHVVEIADFATRCGCHHRFNDCRNSRKVQSTLEKRRHGHLIGGIK